MVAQLEELEEWAPPQTIKVRCPYCGGSLLNEGDEVSCMLCGRPARVTLRTPNGRPLAVGSPNRPRPIRRVGDGEDQRIARGVGRSQGETGMKARLLQRIPEAPSYTTAWALARPMRTSTEEVRSLLSELIELGLVQEVRYQAGCVRPKNKPLAIGYQRPRTEAML